MSLVPTALAAALADRYRIERELGAGGMATVYLAHDLKHERDVALKVLRPELGVVLGSERFLAEIKITARLDHPHILTLIDSGTSDGFLYYVLPFVRGESLRDKLTRERQLGLEDALSITRQVAGALDFAHRQGVVHRDIKPENILLQEGEAMLADFGIALAVKQAGGNRLTETGLSLGTPQYMSPEQATGDRNLDARSDLYSLAAVLYEMLAGEPPVTGPNAQAMIAKLMTERPTRLRVVRDTVPEGVDAAVAKALSKVPADRFTGAAEFATALAAGNRLEPSASRRAVPRGWLATMAIGLVALIVWTRMSGTARESPPSPLRAATPVQLTTSGRVPLGAAVLSPDGSLLVYAEEHCGEGSGCASELIVREATGEGATTIVSKPGNRVWPMGWSPDGRWVLFEEWNATTGAFSGPYIVSQRGGTPRWLSSGDFTGRFVAPDTIVMTRYDHPPHWLHRVVASTGQVVDSILLPIGRSVSLMDVSPDGLRLFAVHRDRPDRGATTLSILDRQGRVSDSLEAPVWVNAVWGGPDAILMGLPAGSGIAVVRRRLDAAGRLLPRGDTLAILADENASLVGMSRDGAALYYSVARSSEVSFWTATRASPRAPFVRGRRIVSSTGRLSASLSPRGGWIIVTTVDGPRARRVVEPFAGGEPRVINMPATGVQDWAFSPSDDSIAVATTQSDGTVALTSFDLRSGGGTARGTAEGEFTDLEWLSDGRLASPMDSGRVIRVFGPGGEVRSFPLPDSLGVVQETGRSPSAPALVVRSVADRSDYTEYLLSWLNLADGRFTIVSRSRTLQGVGNMWWTSDGSVHISVAHGAQSVARDLYRAPIRGGPLEAELPIGFESNASVVGLSHDSRRAVIRVQVQSTDLWTLRSGPP